MRMKSGESALFGRAGASDLANLVHETADEVFLFRLRLLELLTMNTLYFYNIDSTYHRADLLLDGDLVIDLVICDEIHNLGPDLGLDDREFRAAQILRRGIHDCLRKASLLDTHFLLVDDQHGDRLLGCLNGFLLLFLLLLHPLAEKVEDDKRSNDYGNDDKGDDK